MLVEGVENLEAIIYNKSIQNGHYGEAASVFQRTINVIDHFEPYMHLPQIGELQTRVKGVKHELIGRVKKDFEDSFSNPFTKVI